MSADVSVFSQTVHVFVAAHVVGFVAVEKARGHDPCEDVSHLAEVAICLKHHTNTIQAASSYQDFKRQTEYYCRVLDFFSVGPYSSDDVITAFLTL